MENTTVATRIANSAATTAVRESEPATDVLVDALLEDELLVEEISIDGMCGVY